jgi:membrane fusion protein (multidrug efflux system)
MVEENTAPPPKKSKKAFIWTVVLFLVIGLAYLIYWGFYGRFYQWTDDAYVNGNQVVVTPQVPGIVVEITAQNTDFVHKGRVLIQLDKTDAKISLDLSISALGKAVRTVMQMIEQAQSYEVLLPGK